MDTTECGSTKDETIQQKDLKTEDNLNKEKSKSFIDKVNEDIEKNSDSKNIFIQYRIENNHGIIAGEGAEFDEINIKQNTSYKQDNHAAEAIAENKNTLYEWITDNYESYSMAFLIAGAVFEQQPYRWVVESADNLYASFNNKNAEEEKEIAREQRLQKFGAKIIEGTMNTYAGKVCIDIVQWNEKDYPNRILNCIWNEFPQMREKIIFWLEEFILKDRLSMSKRASNIMAQLAHKDRYYFIHDMVRTIMSGNCITNDIIMAQLLVALNKYQENKSNIDNILNNWSKIRNVHYQLTVLLVCRELEDKKNILEAVIPKFVDETMLAILEQKTNGYINNIFNFFAVGTRAFTFYRILIEKLYQLAYLENIRKQDISNLFLNLFSADISLARLREGEDAIFIKLCFANGDIGNKLCYLWRLVWECRYYRDAFYYLLGKYAFLSGKENCEHKLYHFIEFIMGKDSSAEIRQDTLAKILRRTRRTNDE